MQGQPYLCTFPLEIMPGTAIMRGCGGCGFWFMLTTSPTTSDETATLEVDFSIRTKV